MFNLLSFRKKTDTILTNVDEIQLFTISSTLAIFYYCRLTRQERKEVTETKRKSNKRKQEPKNNCRKEIYEKRQEIKERKGTKS